MPTRIIAFSFTLVMCGVCYSDQSDPRLNDLFETLSVSDDANTIRNIENRIWEIWYQHPNEDLERLMEIGSERMNNQQLPEALLIYTRIVETFPQYAEGWNRRATLYYVVGNFEASIADIEKTLALEPRHFGALSGLGLVYLQREELNKAKEAFEALVDVHPNSPNAQENLEFVTEQLRLNVI